MNIKEAIERAIEEQNPNIHRYDLFFFNDWGDGGYDLRTIDIRILADRIEELMSEKVKHLHDETGWQPD